MAAKRASNSGKRRVVFEAEAPPGSAVFLAGSFNAWDPIAKEMTDSKGSGNYRAICMLPAGTYEYKFVIDGEWTVDPQNPNFVVNAVGTLNSVVEVT